MKANRGCLKPQRGYVLAILILVIGAGLLCLSLIGPAVGNVFSSATLTDCVADGQFVACPAATPNP